ncbi:MAG: hypothetical protein DRR08_08050 [Candidatus Parabeggiatoa sp. nov. 2]|nr:MAG: hypothetical protein B6247_07570 [Beggiatoa sp. 4572_84]RKZ61707.1 MAG: hypothetical protein DRR08_08050 [Gammaproteobacteria bacterium]
MPFPFKPLWYEINIAKGNAVGTFGFLLNDDCQTKVWTPKFGLLLNDDCQTKVWTPKFGLLLNDDCQTKVWTPIKKPRLF